MKAVRQAKCFKFSNLYNILEWDTCIGREADERKIMMEMQCWNRDNYES